MKLKECLEPGLFRRIGLYITILLLCLCGNSPHKQVPVPTDPGAEVWVCTGRSSKRYHAYKDCKGLNKCRGSIEEVCLYDAEYMGRTPCHKCYKR